MPPPRLVLASASPRRREILGRITDAFTIEPADIDETPRPDEPADEYVHRLAQEKARTLRGTDRVVIGADTSVVLDGEILGKPADHAHARDMLRRLAGRAHDVVTGVAVAVYGPAGEERMASGIERSIVHVDALDDDTVDWYLATGEGDDKAGGYGLQGAGGLFADRVEGSVSNVIGLPMGLLLDLSRQAGVDLLTIGRT